jgi:hypothetical protein
VGGGDFSPSGKADRMSIRRWLRGGGWLVVAASIPVATILLTNVPATPNYGALSRPAAPADTLPTVVPNQLADQIAPGSSRLLGSDDDIAYFLGAPAGFASGLCFIAVDLAKPDWSQVGCSSPGLGGGFQFADVLLSDSRPGSTWVAIAEDVWRDTEYESRPTAR